MLDTLSRPHVAEPSADVDVVVVGAGAAGISAARTCLAAGLSVAVLEARTRLGGRAVTERIAGHPVDLGAHWMHAGRLNPLVRLGEARGEPLRRASPGSHLVAGGRFARRRERDAVGRGFDRMDRAITSAAQAEPDRAISELRPVLGPWRDSVAATFALISGRPLAEVSVKDFPSDEFGDNYFVRGGYGSYVARLGFGLPIALGTAVHAIDGSGPGVGVETSRGSFRAAAAIVTVPVPVLQAGTIRFTPALPARTVDAIGGFLAGTYEHVVLT